MAATDGGPRGQRMKRTQRTNNAHGLVHGLVHGSGPGPRATGPDSRTMCHGGAHQDPPAASAKGPKPPNIINGTVPVLGINTRKVIPNTGTRSNNRKTTNIGTKASTPALVNGDGKAGERALNRGSSTDPAVVQSNKSRRWRNKLGFRKRRPFLPPPVFTPQIPPPEDEDWETEIQEVEPVDWENRTFGPEPYGPEDLIHFSLRDLSLHQMATPILLTANYRPARRHPQPVKWTCYKIPLEKGQFSDVDE